MSQSLGGTIYFVSATGDNANDGLSPEQPFLTLQHAACLIISLTILYLTRSE